MSVGDEVRGGGGEASAWKFEINRIGIKEHLGAPGNVLHYNAVPLAGETVRDKSVISVKKIKYI
jgi:hypothetical protein